MRQKVQLWTKLLLVHLKCYGRSCSTEGRWGFGWRAKCHRSSWRGLMRQAGAAISISSSQARLRWKWRKSCGIKNSSAVWAKLTARLFFFTSTPTIQILPPFCCGLYRRRLLPWIPAGPAVWCPTATKEYFADINMVMIGEGTPQAVDHWSLVTVRGKQMKSYLLGLEVKNSVCEIALSVPARESKKNLLF